MRKICYEIVVSAANYLAVVLNADTTVLDRMAAWLEPDGYE